MNCIGCTLQRRPMPLPDLTGAPTNPILVVMDSPDATTATTQDINTKSDSYRLLNSTLKKYLKRHMDRVVYDYAIRCCVEDMKSVPAKAFNFCRTNNFEDVVDYVRPSHIIVAGNTALRVATGKSGITKKCNQTMTIEVRGHEYPVIPILSPGFVLRDANQRDRFVSTVKYAARVVTGANVSALTDGGAKIIAYATVNDVLQFHAELVTSNTKQVLAFDVETTSLSPYAEKDFRILSIAIATRQKALVVPVDYPGEFDPAVPHLPTSSPFYDAVQAVLNLLVDPDIPKIAHNAKYDCHCISVRFKVEVANVIGDTLLLHKHLNAVQGGHDLKTVASDLLGCADYSDKLTPYIGAGTDGKKYAKIPYNILAQYNAEDVLATVLIWNKMLKELMKRSALFAQDLNGTLPRVYSMVAVFKLLMAAHQSTYEIERMGIYPRVPYIKQLNARLEVEKQTALSNCLSDRAVVRDILQRTADGKKGKDLQFNPNSDKQVRELLFELPHGYNAAYTEVTASGKPSVNGEVLRALITRGASCSNLCENVLAYRKIIKHQGTFVRGFLNATSHIDGRVHGRLNLFGAVTARLSSDDPNLQNVPREKDYRDMLGVPPGFALIEADYSQIELRILAAYSGDPTMLDVYRNNRDLHMETAMGVFGLPENEVAKEQRTASKAVNFGIAYGLTAHGLSLQLTDLLQKEVSRDEAEVYIRGFFTKYPRVAEWQEAVRVYVTKYGEVSTMFGTVRPLQNALLNTRYASADVKMLYEEAIRHAINTPIQGTAGLCTLFALDTLHRNFKKENEKCNRDKWTSIVSTVHDSILVQTPVANLRNTLILMKEAMVDLPHKLLQGSSFCDVPIVVDFKVGSAWGSMRELNWKGQ